MIVKLTDETDETDVIVVEEANNGCFSMNCVESGLSSVGFLAVAGKKYYLIVDGWNGAIGSYTLSVNCSACEAQCAGKACGPNGCGGLCGNCAAGKTCDLSGASCVDIAANSLCESAKIINHGALPYTDKGSTAAAEDNYFHPEGACVTGSGLPDAGLGARDVAYTITPGKSELFKISMTETDFQKLVYIAEDCNDLFSSCLIAQDMLDSGEMKVALKGGVKYYMIIDGYDGYEAGEFTLSVESLGACVPDCAGKECGGDGCFGTCGGCDVNQECGKDGKCVDKSKNDQCANAKTIDPQNLPFKEKSSTEAASDDYEVPENACPGALQGEFGVQSPDLVYSITPKSDGAYKVYFSDETQFDSALYIVTDCADVAGTCVAGSEVWSDKGGEEISAQLKADTTYYIIVDGYYKNSGVFELVIEKCVPDCQGKECGSDGCGGSCGGCPENEYCSIEYECLASPKNDTCAGAQIISGIPFDTSSTTAVLSDNYSVSADACGGDLTWAAGKGNPDAVFSFTPPETATYHVTVGPAGDWDSAVYILTDCDNPETSCLAGKDEVSQPEHLYAKLTAAKKYYIIVDGYAGGGLFSISVEKCVPQCGGKECGEDGCGGTCGECSGPDEG
ncbi:MAG: hypothetical protein FJ088_09690, partial [Deltaproteobacteria bacterium]|nr:hypothetical protein [Deltaproteobacteria bacterium]